MVYDEEKLLKEKNKIKKLKYSEELMLKYPDKFDWISISYITILSENFIEKFEKYLDWAFISEDQILSEAFIEKYKDKVFWPSISKKQNLSDDFIINNFDKIYFNMLIHNSYFINRKISDKLVTFLKLKGIDIYNEETLLEKKLLTEKYLVEYLKYPEKLMLKYPDKFNWHFISSATFLTEMFIDKFKDYLNWRYISEHQRLSDKFIIKHFNKLDLSLLTNNVYFINTIHSTELKMFLISKGYRHYFDTYFKLKGIEFYE